jgi:hypothetical protein
MRNVFKYALPASGYMDFHVPQGTEVLSAQEQHSSLVLYVAQPDLAPCFESFRVYVVLTGGPVPDDARYLNTVMMHGGDYVVHVFIRHGH